MWVWNIVLIFLCEAAAEYLVHATHFSFTHLMVQCVTNATTVL